MILNLNLAKSKSGLDVHTKQIYVVPKETYKDFGINDIQNFQIDVEYRYTPEFVIVKGKCSMCLTGNCFRCGDEVNTSHSFEFEEKVLPANEEESVVDNGTYLYKGDKIDISKIIEDNLITSLPHKILCKDDCKGLCPQCFANLNTQKCECKPLINNAFACLNDIKID